MSKSKLRDESWKRGDVVEARFSMEAMRRGLVVPRPLQKGRYDLVTDCGKRIWRVQVKSTTVLHGRRAYRLAVCAKQTARRQYKRGEIDFIAGYVIPKQEWYIIPFSAIEGAKLVYLHARSPLYKYREAWNLLLGLPKRARIDVMQAAADFTYCGNDPAS